MTAGGLWPHLNDLTDGGRLQTDATLHCPVSSLTSSTLHSLHLSNYIMRNVAD